MSDLFYRDNINYMYVFKQPIHFVLECAEIEVPVGTGSKGPNKNIF